MSELTPQTVADVIEAWDIMFAGSRKTEEKILLTAKFFKRFRGVYSNEAFRIAAEKVEDSAKFFPTIADMVEVRADTFAEIEARGCSNSLQLPESTGGLTEEEVARNLEKVETIKRMLTGKMTMAEAVNRQQALKWYARQ